MGATFFENQERARRNTSGLVLLFSLGVLSLIVSQLTVDERAGSPDGIVEVHYRGITKSIAG